MTGRINGREATTIRTPGTGRSGHDWLAAEPFTLVLGGGFFGFFAHAGVVQALTTAGLAPARIVGVSAGALAGGLVAAGLEPDELVRMLPTIEKRDFWDPGLPLGGLLRGARFEALLRRHLEPLGIERVEDCPIPLAVVAARPFPRRVRVIEHGRLTTAIRASCAVPLLFRPVRHEGRLLVDGGVSDRSGLAALAPGERAFFHDLPSRRRRSWWTARAETDRPTSTATRRVLRIEDLPAVTPAELSLGPIAIETARRATERWLIERVPGTVSIS